MSLFVSGWRIVSGEFFTVRFIGANLADVPHGRRCGFLSVFGLPFLRFRYVVLASF